MYVSKGLTHPVFYLDLVYKLRRVEEGTNFISAGSKIVKCFWRRQYDPFIIKGTKGIVHGPFTTLYRSFRKRCTLTNKAVGTIWRALSKPPQRRQGLDPRLLWLLVGIPSAFGPELAYRLRVAQPTLKDVPIYFWYTIILLYMFVHRIFRTQEPKAPVTYWDHALSVRRPSSVRLFTFSTASPEPLDGFLWNLVWMKYSRFLSSVVVFCHIPQGRIQDGTKIDHRGSPSSKNFFFRPEGYSNKPNAKLWSRSICEEVLLFLVSFGSQIFDAFLTSFWTLSFWCILMQFL